MESYRPSPSYSLTLRIEYPNRVKTLGTVTSAIGEAGGDIGAIDIVKTARGSITRDITFAASDYEHGQKIINVVRALGSVDIVNVSDRTFLLHLGGKLEIAPKVPVKTRDDISMAYTPGVSRICESIAADPDDAFNLTIKKNMVAVITDGGAVLGMGAAGPLVALPVMEGKALLFKEFAGVDAFPLCLDVHSDDEFVSAVQAVSPTFGAIHLEDIAAPRCFEIETRLSQLLPIPVMHNDQWGTAIAVLAALINALKITGQPPSSVKAVINARGAQAAGIATARLLTTFGVGDIVICDEQGALYAGRDEQTDALTDATARTTNPRGVRGELKTALRGADCFIGFGGQTELTPEDIGAMGRDPIVFEMANPQPEINPESIEDIARIIATGKSDYPNQINNMLCFPGFFRGLLDARASSVTDEMKIAAARAIADVIGRDELHEDYLIPSVFDRRVVKAVAAAVMQAAKESGVARRVTKNAR
ncbi:MAG TPA: NAD-dependent malic enzyme [Abditibacteriaceae bacterium]|jgi:malate dehydrogenase (oxaloacetate-decarboxylating)